jgi:predicted small lipoprotein YifL
MRIAAVAILLTLALAGCGKKGMPEAPGPAADITYPKTYPTH